jgi:hypothetical protein
MDPNQTLHDLRTAVADYRTATSVSAADDAADRLAEHIQALDRWLSMGGFPPAAWQPTGAEPR